MGVEAPSPLLFREWHSAGAAPAVRGSGQQQSLDSTGASERPLREKPEPWLLRGTSNSSMTPPFSSLRVSFWPTSSPSSQGTVQSFHCKGMVRAAQPRHPCGNVLQGQVSKQTTTGHPSLPLLATGPHCASAPHCPVPGPAPWPLAGSPLSQRSGYYDLRPPCPLPHQQVYTVSEFHDRPGW